MTSGLGTFSFIPKMGSDTEYSTDSKGSRACKYIFYLFLLRVTKHWESDKNLWFLSYKSSHHTTCCKTSRRIYRPIKPTHGDLIQDKHFCCRGGQRKKPGLHKISAYRCLRSAKTYQTIETQNWVSQLPHRVLWSAVLRKEREFCQSADGRLVLEECQALLSNNKYDASYPENPLSWEMDKEAALTR